MVCASVERRQGDLENESPRYHGLLIYWKFAMRYGTIVQFFPEKRFGFIRPDRGRDVFFHVTALGACETLPELAPGQPVKYELAPPEKHEPDQPNRSEGKGSRAADRSPGPKAQLVELIDKIPGAVMDESIGTEPPKHARARRKKPTWRR